MQFRGVFLILVVSASILSSGFVCATRVERMEADVAALQLQFNEIQQRINNDQTQMTEMILRADKKLEELGSSQGQTSDRVAQQNIQLAAELEKERTELAAMRGRLDMQQRNIEELQQTLVTMASSIANTSAGSQSHESGTVLLPADQAGLLSFISIRRASGERPQRIAALQEYLKRYPNDAQVEGLLAELIFTLAEDGRDQEAIQQATQYVRLYSKGSSYQEVIYTMGSSGLRIRNCDLAIRSFTMLDKYKDAAARLREARNLCGR